MRKAAFLLGVSIMVLLSLIAVKATKDTALINETVEIETRSANDKETSPLKTREVVKKTVEPTEIDNQNTTEKIQEEVSEEAQLNAMPLEIEECGYAYTCIEANEQKVYLEILNALSNYNKDTVLSTTSPEVMDKAFSCVMVDHPEIFYVDGYKYTKFTSNDIINKLTFSGNYTYSEEEIQRLRNQIDIAVGQMLGGLKDDSTDYEKVKFVYETIVNNTDYEMNAPDNQNICSVFLNHKSVCQGYAKAMQFLLNKLDIQTTLVVGTVKNGEGHAWNLVRIDGAYYYVDCTWGDAYYLLSSQDVETADGKTPSINYDYLCVTTSQIEETHTINSVVPMPECTLMTANYYVMEGAYFTEYNEDKVKKVFAGAASEESEAVTLKCATKAVYDQMLHELIDNQQAFLFYPHLQGSIAYTTCEEQRSISFWL